MTPASNWTFITAAYGAAWVAVAGYWFFVHRAVRRARAQYDQAIGVAAESEGISR
ncbi:MAG: hypothetical protein ACHQSE_09605 [Gemmatimonadales bacterium]